MALAGVRGTAAVASCFGKTLKIIPIETPHFIRNHSVCQSFFDEIPASAACNIKCERTNTTSNDGYAFYRIYFFTIKSLKAQGGRENEARFF